MVLYEEEYKYILGFYLFDSRRSENTEEISNFANKLFRVSKILRSAEEIRYALACYKNVDSKYNVIFDSKNKKFNDWFKKYTDDFRRKVLKNEYKKFKLNNVDLVLENETVTYDFVEDCVAQKKEKIEVKQIEYPRDNQKKNNAIELANYCCELDANHDLFKGKNGKPYVEGHHLIPLKYSDMFDVSLDVEANIICLCPKCHKFLHFGLIIDNELKKLYSLRKERLEKCGISISFNELKSMYERGME